MLTKAQADYRAALVASALKKKEPQKPRLVPRIPLTDPAFKYVDSTATDLRKSFAKYYEAQQAEHRLHESNTQAIQDIFAKRRADNAR